MSQTALKTGKSGGLLHRAVDWAFGYDFFISYAHADGLNYPAKLKEKLELAGFKVFLDKAVYVAGEELRRATRRRVGMSRKLVVIARPAALASEWVRREVDIHLAADKTPIIISVNQAVENASDDLELAAIAHERDWLRIDEEIQEQDNDPTDHCVGELIRSFDATRQETKRLRFFRSAAVALVVLTLSSVLATYFAIENAKRAEQERDIAIARQFAVQSVAALESKPELGLLFAVQSVQTTSRKEQFWLPSAEQALRKVLSSTGGIPLRLAEGEMESIAVSSRGPQLAVGDDQGMVHLWNLSALRNTPTTFRAHDKPVKSFAYSPDGKLIATTTGHAGLKLWNLSSIDGGPQQVLEAESGGLDLFSFSPDGRWLAANAGRTVYVWDIRENWLAFRAPLSENSPGPRQLRFSSNGQWLAMMDESVYVFLLNLTTGEAFTIDVGSSMYFTEMAFSPDSKSFAVGTAAGTVLLLRVDNLIDTRQTYSGIQLRPRLGGPVFALAFSPTENRLAAGSGGLDRTIIVWNIDDSGPAQTVLRGHTDSIRSLAFSPDGKRLASGSADHKVRLWDIARPNDQPVILRGHEGTVGYLLFSYDGRQLITWGTDNTVRVWDASNPQAAPTVFRAHEAAVRGIAFSPDARFLATGSDDGTLRLWNREERREEARLYKGRGDTIYTIDFSANGQWLVAGARGEKPGLWNLNEPQERRGVLLSDYGPQNEIDFVLFSPNGKWIATINDDQIARLWSVEKEGTQLVAADWREESVQTISFNDHGDLLAVGRDDGVVKLWDMKNFQEEPVEFRGHNGAIKYLTFHPAGGLLATAGNDRTVRLWNIHNPEREPAVLRADHGNYYFIKFSRDGDFLAVIGEDTKLQLMKKEGRVFREIFAGQLSGSISQVALSSDNKKLVATSDRIIQIWDLNSPVVAPVILEGHTNSIKTMDLSRDGKWLATGGWDNTVRVWSLSIEYLMNVACSVAGRSMSPDERERFQVAATDEETCGNGVEPR